MQVLSNAGGVAMTNSFLIADENAKEAVIFDAPNGTVLTLIEQAEERGWKVVGLWLTHGHFDHFADHAVVRSRCPGVKILIHELDLPKVAQPEVQLRMFGVPLKIGALKPDGFVTDGQTLHIGSLEVRVMHTPGHACGHVCYYLPSEAVIVGGDLIIGGSVGRTDLPDSNNRQMEASLRKVMALPPQTKLLPGHGDASTLEEERQTNYFLRDFLRDSD